MSKYPCILLRSVCRRLAFALVTAAIGASAQAFPTASVQKTSPPLLFERNQGQAPAEMRFVSRNPGYLLSLNDLGIEVRPLVTQRKGKKTSAIHFEFLSGSLGAPRGESAVEGRSNYLVGNDPSLWVKGVINFTQVRYAGIYPGIDLLYYGNDATELEHDLIVAPGADPGRIAIKVAGSSKLLVRAGDLVIPTNAGELRLRRPLVYQDSPQGRELVQGEFRLLGKRTFGFKVGKYDSARALVIDPILVFSTYLGGTQGATIRDMKADANGNVYVIGDTYSVDFPTAGAYQASPAANLDYLHTPFVTKLNAGGQLVYSTFFGGSGNDEGDGIAVDASGSAYVIGTADSGDFPPTAGAFRTTSAGGSDYFIAKFNPAGD